MIKTKDELLKELNVIYEDNHLIVVEKKENILSQKDITQDLDMTEIIKTYLKEKYQKPGNIYLGLIHRLDRRVGGVMVFAKTSKAASRLSEAFASHAINKYYLAKVKGKIACDGNIDLKIYKDEKNKIAIISEKGKDASLQYQILNYDNNDTFVKIKLITGRYNQIRASFNYINHPVVNDYKYDKTIAKTKDDLGLWCYEIQFNHPITKEMMVFKCLPKGKIWQNMQIK